MEIQTAFFIPHKREFLLPSGVELEDDLTGKITGKKMCYMSKDYFTNMISNRKEAVSVYDFNKNRISHFKNLESFKKDKDKTLIFHQVILFEVKTFSSILKYRLFIPYPYCTPLWSEIRKGINGIIKLYVSAKGWPIFRRIEELSNEEGEILKYYELLKEESESKFKEKIEIADEGIIFDGEFIPEIEIDFFKEHWAKNYVD